MSWAGAVLVLGIGCVGAFYAFHRNNNAPQATPPTNPQNQVPTVTVAQPSPSIAEDKSNVVSKANGVQTEASANTPKQAKKKQESANRKEKRNEEKAAEDARKEARNEAARAKDRRPEAPLEVPDIPQEYIEVPGPNGRRRRIPTVSNRTLPDGTKVMVTPNGTRVVTFPDGTTRVFGPRGKPRRHP
jgi:hypothetical protein